MPTIDDVIAGLVAFRDEVYVRFDALNAKVDSLVSAKDIEQICTTCSGSGEIISLTDVGEQRIQTSNPCARCQGTGKTSWGEMPR